jgi:hypothetical protein
MFQSLVFEHQIIPSAIQSIQSIMPLSKDKNIKPPLHHAKHIVSIALEQALGMASYYRKQVHTQCIACILPCLLCMVAFLKFVLKMDSTPIFTHWANLID